MHEKQCINLCFIILIIIIIINTHGVEVSASCSWICCPGMRMTVDEVVRGMHTDGADCDVDLLRAGELPGLTDD